MSIHHTLIRKFHIGIIPCSTRRLSVRNSISQIFSMGKNRVTKCGINHGFSVCQITCIHRRANVGTSRNIRCVHLRIVQICIRHNYQMMLRKRRITTIVPIIKVHDSPRNVINYPVISQPQIFESAILNMRFLLRGKASSQIFAPKNHTMHSGICKIHHRKWHITCRNLFSPIRAIDYKKIGTKKFLDRRVFCNFHNFY